MLLITVIVSLLSLILPSSVPVFSSVPVELGVGFTFPSNNNNNKNKNPHLISQLLLPRFWPNFKSMYLGTSRTDFICHGDICPGNISPGDICTYQQYLSSYWPNFDQTFWTQFFGGLNFCGPKFVFVPPPTHPPLSTWTSSDKLQLQLQIQLQLLA